MKTAADVIKQVRAMHTEKSAAVSSSIDAKDPLDKGTTTIPDDPAHNQEIGKLNNSANAADTTGQTPEEKSGPGVASLGKGDNSSIPQKNILEPNAAANAALSKSGSLLEQLRGATTVKPQASAPAAPAASAPVKAAGADQFSESVLAKMAMDMLSVEGGIEECTRLLTKKAGADEARSILHSAIVEAVELEKLAAYQDEQEARAHAWHQHLALQYAELTKSASEQDIEKIDAMRHLMGSIDALPEHLKQAAMAGLEDGAEMAEGVSPETGEAPEGMEAGALPGSGDEEPISNEALAEALIAAVESGEIPEEQALPILEALAQEAGGGEAAAKDPAAAEAEAAMAE